MCFIVILKIALSKLSAGSESFTNFKCLQENGPILFKLISLKNRCLDHVTFALDIKFHYKNDSKLQ